MPKSQTAKHSQYWGLGSNLIGGRAVFLVIFDIFDEAVFYPLSLFITGILFAETKLSLLRVWLALVKFKQFRRQKIKTEHIGSIIIHVVSCKVINSLHEKDQREFTGTDEIPRDLSRDLDHRTRNIID